jgi:phosphatidylinositol-bisphosphatase
VLSTDLVGIYIGIWVTKNIVHRLQSVESDTVKCGLGGTLGNKGAVMVRFIIDNS